MEKDTIVIAGHFNHHFESNAEDYEDQNGSHDYRVRCKEWEKILESCTAMNMTAGNSLFKKTPIRLVTCKSGQLLIQIDHCLVRRN